MRGVPLEHAIAQTCVSVHRKSAREEWIRMLGRAISSFSKPFKKVPEGGFKIEMKSGEIRNPF